MLSTGRWVVRLRGGGWRRSGQWGNFHCILCYRWWWGACSKALMKAEGGGLAKAKKRSLQAVLSWGQLDFQYLQSYVWRVDECYKSLDILRCLARSNKTCLMQSADCRQSQLFLTLTIGKRHTKTKRNTFAVAVLPMASGFSGQALRPWIHRRSRWGAKPAFCVAWNPELCQKTARRHRATWLRLAQVL